jgi:multidrug efflux pump subunit AcrA (membrane-fusion protein)
VKTKFLWTLVVVLAILGAVGWIRPGKSTESEPEAKGAGPSESPVTRNAEGESVVHLAPEIQRRMGMQIEPLATAESPVEVQGYGRVVDPGPLAALIAELAPAEVAARTSRQELERVKALHDQNNASTRVLQAAEATAQRDELTAASLRLRLHLAWGKTLSEQPDLPAFVRTLTDLESALIRIDLPAGTSLPSSPLGARLGTLNNEQASMEAPFFGAVTSTDPQTQGQGFLFLVQPNAARLAPGMAVTGFVRVAGEPLRGVWVPRPAVLRHEGKAWVYLQTGDAEFTRREISLDHSGAAGWLVNRGVKAGDRAVVAGPQTVLSEELKGMGLTAGERE